MTQTWVDLAPAVEPIRAWLQTTVGKTVRFARAPSGGQPPFVVLFIVSDPRPLVTMDGGIPADVTWQLDSMGDSPAQALALADLVARAMMVTAPPDLPVAYVALREAIGDTSGPERISDNRFVVRARFRWTLVATQ